MGFKIELWHVVVIGIIFAMFTGLIAVEVGDYKFGGTGTPTTPWAPTTPSTPGTELVTVTKQLKFVVIDKYAGGAPTGTGGYLYDNTGKTLMEGASNAISSGSWTTSNNYQSGTEMVFKYIYDTTIDDIFTKKFTVPQMSSEDAQALTTNTITVYVYDLPASLTDSAQDNLGNSYADAGNWNKTTGDTPGQNTATCTYSWYVGTDNDGYLSWHDYEYDIDCNMILWVKVFGTNYENVILTGFDGAYEKGSAMYYYHIIPDTEVTKYKVGQDYVYSGAGSFSWTVDLTGYSGDAGDMQCYIEVHSSQAYHQQFGSFGPNAGEMAEHTINLVD